MDQISDVTKRTEPDDDQNGHVNTRSNRRVCVTPPAFDDAGQENVVREEVKKDPIEIAADLARIGAKVSRYRQGALKRLFDVAEQAETVRKYLSEGEFRAFLTHECGVPAADAEAYALFNLVLTPVQKAELIKAGAAVDVVLALAKETATVRDEILKMLNAGRNLQASDVKLVRRDVTAKRTLPSRHEIAQRDLCNAAARQARKVANTLMGELHRFAEDFIALYEADEMDPSDAATRGVLDELSVRARQLYNELVETAGSSFLDPDNRKVRGRWADVANALERIASGDFLFLDDAVYRSGTEGSEADRPIVRIRDHIAHALAWPFEDDDLFARLEAGDKLQTNGLDTRPTRKDSYAMRDGDLSVLEICAGAGGQALGLHACGFQPVALYEVDEAAVETMRINKGDRWNIIKEDIRAIDFRKYKGIDLLAGGVPCQSFSSAGERKGKDDERNLFGEALRIVRETKPKAVMFENVRGVLQKRHLLYRLELLAELARLGYDAEWRVVKGADFALGQKRERAILVGFKRGMMHRFRWPEKLEKADMSVGQLLGDLMAEGGWPHADEWAARASEPAPTLIGGSRKKSGMDLAQQLSRETWAKYGVNASYVAIEPPGPEAGQPAYVGELKERLPTLPYLTLRMLARLQGFDDIWRFAPAGSPETAADYDRRGDFLRRIEARRESFRQITNAFPPRLARAVGLSIRRALTGDEFDLETVLPTKTHVSFSFEGLRKREPSVSDPIDPVF